MDWYKKKKKRCSDFLIQYDILTPVKVAEMLGAPITYLLVKCCQQYSNIRLQSFGEKAETAP